MKSLDDVGGRHPEFRDRKPDLPPLPPPEPDPGPPRASLPRWLAWFFVGLGVVPFVIAALLAVRQSRLRTEEHFLGMLKIVLKQYQGDTGVLPPGDGQGSADLVRALRSPTPRGAPYLAFTSESTDAGGNLLVRSGALVRYRAPGLFGEFDLWIDSASR